MSEPAQSLITASAAAERAAPPFSFFSEIEEAEKRLAEVGEFTGERLFRDRPGVYAAAVRMIAEGQSISATARALGISRNTVCAVRDREGISIEQEKKELLRDLRRAGRLSVEKVIELLPDVKSAKDAAITAAVMLDKQQLLSGEATSRVERVEARPDQVKAFLDSLPVVDAELIEVVSTGIEPEKPGQRAAAAAPATLSLGLSSEIASDDKAASVSYETPSGTTPRTTDGFDTPPPGGGGGRSTDSPHCGVIDTEKQNFGQRAKTDRSVASARGLGGRGAGKSLCNRTKQTKQGGRKPAAKQPARSSQKARISQKKKGGSGC